MTKLIRLVVLRHLLRSPGRSSLTVLGIVLGVAVVFAIELANASVIAALRSSMTSATDKVQLTVGAEAGVEDAALDRVREVAGVEAAIPVIEATVRDERAHVQLAVLAVDLLSKVEAQHFIAPDSLHIDDELSLVNDPHGVLLTAEYARRTRVAIGDKLQLETARGSKEFVVHGTFEPRGAATGYAGDLVVMDVYCAQIAFDRGQRFDRIDIIAQPEADLRQLAERVQQALGGAVMVQAPRERSEEVERLLGGFQLGLTLASTIALFVGAFIVYNSLAISVARRRREIGIMRALGATGGQVLALFVGEGALLGVLGTGIGLAFGWLLARLALQFVAATVSALYVPVAVRELVVTARDVWTAAGLGLTAALIAAYIPARRAAATDPISAMRGESSAGAVAFSSTRTLLIGSVASLLLAGLVAWAGHVWHNSSLTFVVAALVSFSAAFLAPALTRAVGSFVHSRAKAFGPAVMLGAVTFARNAGRNAVAIAALSMALASVVNIDALIDSMKSSTDAWLGRSFRADLFVFAGTKVRAKFERPLRESLREELSALPNVEFVQAFRMARQTFNGESIYLMSEDFEGYRRYNELAVVDGDVASAVPALDAGTGIAASEAFASKFHLGMGDDVSLPTPDGPRQFRIVLVYTDFRADTGILFTTRDTYKRIWRDSLVDLFSLYLKPGASAAPARAQITATWGASDSLLAVANAEYRSELVALVGRSMALSRATEFVAVFVAVLGIINTLLVGVFDRRRELGVLKAIGAARTQLTRMVLTESVLIAATSALLGVILGTGLSAYMVIEALRVQVGWRIAFQLSGWVIVEAFIVALGVAWLAAWLPMRWAAKLEVVDALQYD
ncbi:MAG TPA: FtsX-like permease family protein [Polyangiales bacterium]|nr:FtsX-like permease family protein [Polyangiales bacterium]